MYCLKKLKFLTDGTLSNYLSQNIHVKVASGGHSEVYCQKNLDGSVYRAVKKIDKRRFPFWKHELEAMKNISGDHIVRYLGHKEGENEVSIYMTYYEGDVFDMILDKVNTHGEKVSLFLAMVKCVKEVHDSGYVHLDVKPENFFVDGSKIVIGDFGCSTKMSECRYGAARFIGTEKFLSPEIYHSGDLGPESDVWSLGVCLFIIMFKEFPWNTCTLPTEVDLVLKEIKGKCQGDIFDIIKQCLEFNKKSRIRLDDLLVRVLSLQS